MSKVPDIGSEIDPQELAPMLEHDQHMHVLEPENTAPSNTHEGVFSTDEARVIDATERIAQRLAMEEVRLVEVDRFTLTAPFAWSGDHSERTLQQRKFNSMGVKGPTQIEAREPERIDNVLLIETRKTVDGREHRLVSLEIDGNKHVMWLTYPKNRTQDDVLVLIGGGLGEIMEGEIGWQQHQQVAKDLPQAVVASHSTYGVGKHGERLGPTDLPGHNMKQLAEHKKALLEAVFGSYPTVLVGTSENTVVNNIMAAKNQKIPGNPLRIVGIVNHASALVPPDRIVWDMIIRFPVGVVIDTAQELTLKSKPQHMMSNFNTLRHSAPRLLDIPVLGRQALSLMRGTKVSTLERLVGQYGPNYITIVGEKDSLGQHKMWDRLLGDGLQEVEAKGHGMAVQAIKSGKAISKAIKKMDLSAYTNPAAA